MNANIMIADILEAFCKIKPRPAWLEISPRTLTPMLREIRPMDWEPPKTPDDPPKFFGVPVIYRRLMVGWRVAALASDVESAKAFARCTVTVDGRGREIPTYIASEDFDEAEQLSLEAHRERMRRNG